MNWGSLADFLAMGGYGFYVWGSFGLALVAFATEFALVRHRAAAIVGSLKRQAIAARLDKEIA